MNTVIGVYNSHDEALKAVEELKIAGYPVQQLSLIGKAVIIDDLVHVRYNIWVKNIPAIVGAVIGPILGMLTGMKLFAIPGLGFLFGIGGAVGGIAGFSLGIVFGGILSLIAIFVIKSRSVLKYKEHIEERGFQVVAHGSKKEVDLAVKILSRYNESKKIH